MKTAAIDPGTEKSAFIVWDGEQIDGMGEEENSILRDRLLHDIFDVDLIAIEMVASFGMPVGKEVFETVLWIGRFLQAAECSGYKTKLVYRKDVKIHLCGTMRAKDGNIRQALMDKHGTPGTVKAKGKLYGVSKHLWSALAIADYVLTSEQPAETTP